MKTPKRLTARARPGLPAPRTRGSGVCDIHQIAVWVVHSALDAAFRAGLRSGMALEPGILAVHHSPELGYYPWQVLIEGERCVLLSGDLRSRSVISSRYYPGDHRPRTVPIQDVPREVLDAARAALGASAP